MQTLTLRPDQPFHCLRILPSRYTVFRVIGQSNQKLGVFLLAGLLCGNVAAQGMYKCKDAAGKITYSGKECGLIGQTDAGEVTGRAVVTPAVKSKAPPPAPAAVNAPTEAPPQQAPATAPASERRCFTVKTAKGTATRCNDKPDEDDAPAK